MRSALEWREEDDGTWWARTSRDVDGRYVIEPRYQDGDIEMFDVLRLKPNGRRKWRSNLVGTTLNVETAKLVAQKNFARRVASNHEQSIDEKKIF